MKSALQKLVLIWSLMLASLSFAAGVVDLNRADAKVLSSLQNIGPAKAARIIEYRETHGPFQQIEDLAKVRGIGSKTVELNRERLSVTE